MKQIYKAGDLKEYRHVVKQQDVASFGDAVVHEVYSTFALARDVEWTTRQFALDIIEEGEEGVGTFLQIRHEGPAFVGEEIIFTGIFDTLEGSELICSFEARVGNRRIASGMTGQKILTLEKIKSIFRHG